MADKKGMTGDDTTNNNKAGDYSEFLVEMTDTTSTQDENKEHGPNQIEINDEDHGQNDSETSTWQNQQRKRKNKNKTDMDLKRAKDSKESRTHDTSEKQPEEVDANLSQIEMN